MTFDKVQNYFLQLNLSDITSTGRGGRVLKEDILKHLNISSEDSNNVQKMKEAKPTFAPQTIKTIPAPLANGDKVFHITGFTKAMVKTMTASLVILYFFFTFTYPLGTFLRVGKQIE